MRTNLDAQIGSIPKLNSSIPHERGDFAMTLRFFRRADDRRSPIDIKLDNRPTAILPLANHTKSPDCAASVLHLQ
jgi:hypothetical protein